MCDNQRGPSDIPAGLRSEAEAKEAAHQAWQNQANQASTESGAIQSSGPMTPYGLNQMSESDRLRRSVKDCQYEAERLAKRAAELHELAYLLDKHPEVARILQLKGV